MIIGECVNCGETHLWNTENAKFGAFAKVVCNNCETPYWIYVTRMTPVAFTEYEFSEKYIINEQTNEVSLRNPPPPLTPQQQKFMEMFNQMVVQSIAREIIGE